MSDRLERINRIFAGDPNDKGKPKGKGSWSLQFMTVALLIVTGYFTWDYLYNAMRDKQFGMIVAVAGLAAFDLGALLWSNVWKSNSSNGDQDAIARALFIVDVVGMLLTTLGSSVPAEQMPQIIHDLTPFVIGSIIVINVVAKFEYDNRSDAVEHAREFRKRNAQISKMAMQSDLELEMQEAELNARRKALEQQELLAAQEQEIAQAELRLQSTHQGLARARVTGEHIEHGKQAVQSNAIQRFGKWWKGVVPPSEAAPANSVPGAGEFKVVTEDELSGLRGNGNTPKP